MITTAQVQAAKARLERAQAAKDEIRLTKETDYPYRLVEPSPAQLAAGFLGPVARFVASTVACAVKTALKAAQEAWWALAAALIAEREVGRFVRRELYACERGGLEDEGRLRGVDRPFKARAQVEKQVEAFYGPRRVLGGEA